VDLDAVRTFVAVAEAGQFSEAAADLSITQQAASKRVAGLEKHLGVRLFARTARGARLTVDGQAFLPRARDLLRAAFYAELAAAFRLSIDTRGPNFGLDPLLETVASTPRLATFVGQQTHLTWPAGYGLRRIPVREPVPVYPHALLWRQDNPHPALTALRSHLKTMNTSLPNASTWTPAWA
jgi:DNA-binding transcriptional LysR family regulator